MLGDLTFSENTTKVVKSKPRQAKSLSSDELTRCDGVTLSTHRVALVASLDPFIDFVM